MKNKLKQLREKLSEHSLLKNAPRPVRWIVGSLSNNLGYKLLSLLLAILLWNYVISTNTSITRSKTVYNLTGTVSGQSTLTANKLALTERPEAVEAGTVALAGTDHDKILGCITRLLDDGALYARMSSAVNPYGDGLAAARIAKIVFGLDGYADFNPESTVA